MESNKKIDINLGLVCNNACRFCLNGLPTDERGFVPFESLAREVKHHYKEGYRALGFLGGEPTIYPKIVELVSLAHRLGYEHIDIVSNGRRYRYKEFVERLIKSGVTRFYVSIHSHKPAIEDYLTSVKGSFREKIQGLHNLMYFRRKGLIKDRIYLNIVINRSNYRYIKNIMLFYYKMGFVDFRFNFVRPGGRAFLHGRRIVPSYSAIMKYVKQAIESSRSLNVNLFFGGMPFCLFHKLKIGDFRAYIGEFRDGDKEVIFGKRGRVKFVMREESRTLLRAKEKSCTSCIYNSACEGPWKNYINLYGFNEFKPVKKADIISPKAALVTDKGRIPDHSLHR